MLRQEVLKLPIGEGFSVTGLNLASALLSLLATRFILNLGDKRRRAAYLRTCCSEARLRRSEKDHHAVFKHFSSSQHLTVDTFAYYPVSYFLGLPAKKGKDVVAALTQRIAAVSWRVEGKETCNAVTEEVSVARARFRLTPHPNTFSDSRHSCTTRPSRRRRRPRASSGASPSQLRTA